MPAIPEEIQAAEHEGAKIRADLKFQRNRYERVFLANEALAKEAGYSSMSKKKKGDDDSE